MGTISDKLNKLIENKESIRQSIIAKGVDVSSDIPLSEYGKMIENITTGDGDPYYEELYNIRTSNGTDMTSLFARCTGNLDLSKLDTSKVTNMSYMFEQSSCNVNCSGWDTSNVTDTNHMFNTFTGYIDLSNLDFSNVTSSIQMFHYGRPKHFNGIENLSFPKLTKTDYMFYYFEGDSLNLSNWNTGTLTSMSYMFNSAKIKKIDLSNWDTSNVINMSSMFSTYSDIIEELIIPDWDMSKVSSSYKKLFSGVTYLSKLKYIDLSRSNDATITTITSQLPTKTETTYGKMAIPADSSEEVINGLIAKYWKPIGPDLRLSSCSIISELDEVLVGNTTKIFMYDCAPWYGNSEELIEYIVSDESVLTIDNNGIITAHSPGSATICVRLVDTQEVISDTITITVSETDSYPNVIKFKGTSTPSSGTNYIYINGTNAENRVPLTSMDYNSITGIYTYDAGVPITSIRFNGYNISSYDNTCTDVIKLSDTTNITDMASMFSCCSKLTSLNTTNWYTSNVTSMISMFKDCKQLASLDISKWDTSKVTSMNSMFYGCNVIPAIDLSKWNTSSVTDMRDMFHDCFSLTSLDISNWDTSEVTKTSNMFYACNTLTSIKGEINFNKCTSFSNTFKGCYKLEELYLVDICKDTIVTNSTKLSLDLGETIVKDECLISIISELPDLIRDHKISNTSNMIFTLPHTNTLTAEQVQPAIDKGWTISNINF